MYFGRVYSMPSPDYKKSIYYYKQALELAQMNQNWRKFDTVIWELIGIFEFIDDFQTAYTYAQMGLHSPYRKGEQPDERLSMILGHIYSELGKVDSAYSYLSKATTSNIPEIKRSAYNYLYNLERRQGNYREALGACEQCLIYNDSVYRTQKANELIEMQAKYDQQKVIAERNQLQIDKEHIVRNTLVAIVILIIFIAYLIITYQRALIRKEQLLKRQEELARQNTLKLAENEIQMSRNKQRIAELTQQIASNQGLKEQLDEQLEAIKQMKGENNKLQAENQLLLEDINRQTQTFKDISKELEELDRLISQNKHLHEQGDHLAMLLVNRSPLLNKIKNRHPYIKDTEWGELEEELDLIFEHYPKRLQQQVSNISESELRLAYLIKLKMPNKDMAEALGISPASVAKSKMRLKDRLSHGILTFDGTKTVDVWLWDF